MVKLCTSTPHRLSRTRVIIQNEENDEKKDLA